MDGIMIDLQRVYKEYVLGEEEARKREIHRLADYYSSAQEIHLKKYFQDADIPVSIMPVTEYIINKKSQVYKSPASRIVGDTSTGVDYKGKNERYKEATQDKNGLLKENERQTNLLGNTAIYVGTKEKLFEYKIIKYFIPHFDKDFTQPIGISYPLDVGNPETYWEHWFPNEHYITDSAWLRLSAQQMLSLGIEETETNYDSIPFSFWHSGGTFSDFWSKDAGPLVNANEKINMALTDLNLYLRKQGFSWVYATGVHDAESIQVGYDKITNLPDPQSTLNTVQFPERTKAFTDAIEAQIKYIAKMYHVDIEFEITGAPSGFSLVVRKLDSLEDWNDQKEVFRIYERDLYRVERMVAMADWKYEFPEVFSVNFADIQLPVSNEEKRANIDWEVSKNLTTYAKYYTEEIDTDITEEEAEQIILQNAEKNKTVVRTATPPTALERLIG